MRARFRICWLLVFVGAFNVPAAAQSDVQKTSGQNDSTRLTKIEDDLIHKLSAIQKTGPQHKASHFQHSMSARQIACSLPAKQQSYWYFAVLNNEAVGDLTALAELDSRLGGPSVGVGAWFAVTPEHPDGAYWVVARPLPTNNPVWYALSIFTDCPFLRCSRLEGTYPITSACESNVR
jgi:hypothetical protein